MKKVITLLLLASMLVGTFACGSTSTGNEDTTTSGGDDTTTAEVTTEELLKPNLPENVDYEGYTFTFYGRGQLTSQYIEEESGETMDDAVYKRNRDVADLLNINFALASDSENGSGAKNTILAGEDAYDVVMPHGRHAFSTYAAESLAVDWHTSLPYVDLDQPWWSQDARDNFTICNKLYAMIGDIDYAALGATKCMFFNMSMFDEYGWEYPYQTVLDGDWTWNEFLKTATEGARDLNGDTKLDIATDRFGFATTWWGTPINILFTADEHIVTKTEDNELELALNNERVVGIFESFFDAVSKEGMYIHMADDGAPVYSAFREGRLLFIETLLGSAKNYRDMNDEFGIIPCPKYDDTMDSYITGVDASTSLLLVPITAENLERTSVILEALAYYGWKDVIPTYYDVALSVKYARDEESIQMMDIIREGRRFDCGYYINLPNAVNSIGWALCKTEDHNFSSYYASIETQAKTEVEKLNEFYRD